MRKVLIIMATLFALLSFNSSKSVFAEQDILIDGCKSAYLIDFDSGTTLYSLNEEKRVPIASVCKVMTLLVCFDAIENGDVSLDQTVVVSKNAAGMGGSQIFLQENNEYAVSQLIKSIIVCSANDSCVAMAETICGSEELFVAKMNEKAKNLGCENTKFSNCTGLPKPNQYSCAKDVAIMFSNLVRHKEYFNYSKIWLENFVHPDNRLTCMTNTNKLLRKYNTCDGGKTGFTNEAGFCLAATALKNNMRVVSVILGADSSDLRFDNTIKLFNFAFANYKNMIVMDEDVNFSDKIEVCGGAKEFLTIKPAKSVYVLNKNGENCDVSKVVNVNNAIAPIKQNQVVGSVDIYKNGVIYTTIDVVASEDVNRASFVDNLNKIAERWAF